MTSEERRHDERPLTRCVSQLLGLDTRRICIAICHIVLPVRREASEVQRPNTVA
jgi:uncharacterized protein (DUF2342 family)